MPSTFTHTSSNPEVFSRAQARSSALVHRSSVAPEQKSPAGLIRIDVRLGTSQVASTNPPVDAPRNHTLSELNGPQLFGSTKGFSGVGVSATHVNQSAAHARYEWPYG